MPGTSTTNSTTENTTPKATPPPTTHLTPKMSHLLGLNYGYSSSIISYFGPMSFLDDHSSFVSIFGEKVQLLGRNPSCLDMGGVGDTLRLYVKIYMFDVFLVICREDYIGTGHSTLDSNMVYEICNWLAKLRVEWNGGLRLATVS